MASTLGLLLVITGLRSWDRTEGICMGHGIDGDVCFDLLSAHTTVQEECGSPEDGGSRGIEGGDRLGREP